MRPVLSWSPCHHPRAYCVSGGGVGEETLPDNESDFFGLEVHLRPGREHPNVRGTELLGVAKFHLYPNAKLQSVEPIQFVGECAAAEEEIVENFFAGGWIELCPASEWASNGFVALKKEKGKWRLVVDYR